MLDPIYIADTGLQAFSKGLNNISANVANLNSAGFKRSSLQFQDLLYSQGVLTGRTGNGVQAGKPSVIQTQGEMRQSGNATDAAIDGEGYFILQKDGKTRYTRDGEFEFDKDSYLVARQSRMRVMVLNAEGSMGPLNISALRSLSGVPTSSIKLDGTLSTGDSDRSHTISDLSVVSSAGIASTMGIVFTDQTDPSVTGVAHTWGFKVNDSKNNSIASGTLIFGPDGSPQAGSDKFSFDWTPAQGAASQKITLDFGEPGSFAGLTSFSAGTTSTAKLNSIDGKTSGNFTGSRYEADGSVVLNYSNGETRNVGRLALAWFDDQSRLEAQGAGLWLAPNDKPTLTGTAQGGVFGKIGGGQIEASNVDLTQQFSELIIVQRGYQASSQVINTSNDMIQQLFDTRKRN
jgi:flagellar hook protein FlgE